MMAHLRCSSILGAASRAGLRAALVACLAVLWTGCKSERSKHYEAAKRFRDQGQFEKAVEEFNAVIALEPNHIKSHYSLACVYRDDLDNPEKAIEHFRRVVEIDPQYAKAWRKLSECYQARGNQEAAIKALQDALTAGAFDDKPDEKEDVQHQIQLLLDKGGETGAASAPTTRAATPPPADDETSQE